MLVNVGNGSYANLDQIYAVISNKGQTAQRLRKICKEQNLYYSLTGGDKTRSLLIFNNGMVMGSSFKPPTIKRKTDINESIFLADKIMGREEEDIDEADEFEEDDYNEEDDDD